MSTAITPIPVNDPGLVEQAEDAHAYFQAARSEATRTVYAAQFRQFRDAIDCTALPATPQTVALHVTALAKAGYAVATIQTRLAAIAAVHRDHGHPDPTRNEVVRRVVRGIARQHGTRPSQARGLTETDVAKIEATTGTARRDLRDWAMLLVARDLLARRAELVALDVEDLTFTDEGDGTATIRRSKTDPDGQGYVGYLAKPTVAAMRRWLDSQGIATGAVFTSIGTCNRLHAKDVARRFRTMAERAGIPPQRVSGHSARVGMAQDLTADGASLPELQQAGRWSSPAMPARYAEHQAAKRGAVARFHQKRG